MLVFFIAAATNAHAGEIHVSPSGSDTNPGTAALPVATLTKARALASGGGAATVVVEAGDYFLQTELMLGPEDSDVTWIGNGMPRITSGAAVGPWSPSQLGGNIVQADVSHIAGRQDRHLWVNGRRAVRTRMPEDSAVALFHGSTMSDLGFALVPPKPLSNGSVSAEPTPPWPRGGRGVEFVYPQSTSAWTEPRCAVKSANATFIEMQQPCWTNLLHKACNQGARGPPSIEAQHGRAEWLVGAPNSGRGYVENVGPTPGMQPGEWALDAEGKTCYYALRPGEEGGEELEGHGAGGTAVPAVQGQVQVSAVMPTLTKLLGVVNASHVTFEGLRFEYATWLGAGGPDGYVEQQSGCGTVGSNKHNSDCTTEWDYLWSVALAPGAISLADSSSISFVGCEVAHVGGVGIELTRSTHCLIDGCSLYDVSGNGIQVGQFADPLASHLDRSNMIVDTRVNKAAAEYSGGVAIAVGYTVGTIIEHCDLSNLTYGGLSMGWGWSRHACWTCTNAGWNRIANNRIHDYKQTMNDGGGVYMLGPQNGSVVSGNWVHDQHTPTSGALYPDEGSAYSVWRSNVVTSIGTSKWLHLWTGSIHDVLVEGNYVDTPRYLNHGTNCTMRNNTVFRHGEPPAEAKAIIDAAGVRGGSKRVQVTSTSRSEEERKRERSGTELR